MIVSITFNFMDDDSNDDLSQEQIHRIWKRVLAGSDEPAGAFEALMRNSYIDEELQPQAFERPVIPEEYNDDQYYDGEYYEDQYYDEDYNVYGNIENSVYGKTAAPSPIQQPSEPIKQPLQPIERQPQPIERQPQAIGQPPHPIEQLLPLTEQFSKPPEPLQPGRRLLLDTSDESDTRQTSEQDPYADQEPRLEQEPLKVIITDDPAELNQLVRDMIAKQLVQSKFCRALSRSAPNRRASRMLTLIANRDYSVAKSLASGYFTNTGDYFFPGDDRPAEQSQYYRSALRDAWKNEVSLTTTCTGAAEKTEDVPLLKGLLAAARGHAENAVELRRLITQHDELRSPD